MNIDEPDPIPAASDTVLPAEPEFYEPPRLGIIHLLAWTAMAGVMFKVDAALRLLDKDRNSVQDPIGYQVLRFSHLALIAAGIVGLAVLFRAWFHRQRGRLASGHWILIGVMVPDLIVYVASAARYGFISLYESPELSDVYWLLILFHAAAEVFRAVLFILAARRIRERCGWRGIFCLLAIVSVGEAVLYDACLGFLAVGSWMFFKITSMVQRIAVIAQVLTSLVLGIVALNDLLRARRDWPHCLGVSLYLVFSLLRLSYFILSS